MKELPNIRFVRTHKDARLPGSWSLGNAGWDVAAVEDVVIDAFTPIAINTGWKIAVPEGYEVQIRPRSGLAKKGITVANSPGTIDANYRGDLLVLLVNISGDIHTVRKGDRIAQLVLKPVYSCNLNEVDSFDDETDRGENGFGSSGR